MHKKNFSIILLLIFAIPIFAYAAEIPETVDQAIEESKEIGEKIFDKLPQEVENLLDKEVLPIWQRMLDSAVGFWEKNIASKLKNIWQKILGKIEEKKPELQQEIEKEKQEIKDDLKGGAVKAGKSLFQRFLDLFRDEKSSDSPESTL